MIKFLKNKQIRNVCVVNTIVSYPFSLKLGVCSQCESLLLSAVLYRELQSLILCYHSDSLNYVKVRSGLVCGSLGSSDLYGTGSQNFKMIISNNLRVSNTRVRSDCKSNKTLGRALDPRANGTWLSKLTE